LREAPANDAAFEELADQLVFLVREGDSNPTSRKAIKHCLSTCSIGCAKPRSMPSESAATSSARYTTTVIG
jgi:hypothetical protein